ncbi:transcription initiation factor IIF, beta subunit-domain-containing protein [Cyathus striatus]|nr:transcription initiation factor IIF, beta subunit-domain-containing protein [Cyathus striatus]
MNVTDHKNKTFIDEHERDEDDAQPDSDEYLSLDQGYGIMWIVKIPKFLMERWSAVEADDIHLATLRVYPDPKIPNAKPRIILFLPPNHDPSSSRLPLVNPERPHFDSYTTYSSIEPDIYELEIVNGSVMNQLVVGEQPKDSSSITRARTTALVGEIKHECNLRPVFNANYRKTLRERNKKYNAPTRSIKMIDDARIRGDQGGINRLTSGVGVGAERSFSNFVPTKAKPTKGNVERMVRIPRDQLLDRLFPLFREKPYWDFKALREKTQQPEKYLKEVLGEIGFLHKGGEWRGAWELNKNFIRNVRVSFLFVR